MASSLDAPRLRRTWPQRLLIWFNMLVVVGLLAAAGILGYGYEKFGQIPRVELGQALSPQEDTLGGAENYLIVGTDSAEGLDPNDPVRAQRGRVGGLRSDTIMILHVDPASETALLLSLPRDLFVPIAGTGGSARINSAINTGPERLIETVQEYFSIPINHYVQVDFAGFVSLVDTVDGVPVYFEYPTRDKKTGLNVPEAGCVELRGDQALAYVRSRAFEQQIDGRWRVDGTGDLGRVSRQQDFIKRALRRAISQGIRNPTKLDALINAGLDAVTVDSELSADDVVSLGNRFRSFNPDELVLYTLPVTDDQVGGAAVLRLVDSEAQPILDLFRGIDPGTLTESSVRVRVLNGSGVSDQATIVTTAVRLAGFGAADPADAPQQGVQRTEIHHPPGSVAAADLLNRWLVTPAVFVEDDQVVGGDVALVTGVDFAGLLETPRDEAPAAVTSTTSTSTTTTIAGETFPSSTTTTSTVIGAVPVEPVGTRPCG